jgi:hypothetical protein
VLHPYGSLPPQSRDEPRASMTTASHVGSTVDEYAEATSSMDAAQSLREFDAKPLIVLTAGRGNDAEWRSAQDDMATLSTNSVHRVVAAATHASLVEDKADATATSQAIAMSSRRYGPPPRSPSPNVYANGGGTAPAGQSSGTSFSRGA